MFTVSIVFIRIYFPPSMQHVLIGKVTNFVSTKWNMNPMTTQNWPTKAFKIKSSTQTVTPGHMTGDRWHLTGDMWQVTSDILHVTGDTWHMTNETNFMFWSCSYSPPMSRYSVSSVRILEGRIILSFSWNPFKILTQLHQQCIFFSRVSYYKTPTNMLAIMKKSHIKDTTQSLKVCG